METDKLPANHVHGLRTRWTRFISLLKIFKKYNDQSSKNRKRKPFIEPYLYTCSISCILCAIYFILLYIRMKGQIIINWKIVGLFSLSKNTKTSVQQLLERHAQSKRTHAPAKFTDGG